MRAGINLSTRAGINLSTTTLIVIIVSILVLVALLFLVPALMHLANNAMSGPGNLFNHAPF